MARGQRNNDNTNKQKKKSIKKTNNNEIKVDKNQYNGSEISFDKINIEILKLLIKNPTIKSLDIANKLNIPLSTIQRRKSRIENSSLLQKKYEIDYHMFRLRTADMLIKVSKGDVENVAQEIVNQHSKNVLEISIRIGYQDFNLVVKVVYKDSDEIYSIMRTISKIDHVESVQWSEIVKTISKRENGLVENIESTVNIINNQI